MGDAYSEIGIKVPSEWIDLKINDSLDSVNE